MNTKLEPGQKWMIVRGPNKGAVAAVERSASGQIEFTGMSRGLPLEVAIGEDVFEPLPEPCTRTFAELLGAFDVAYARAVPLRYAEL